MTATIAISVTDFALVICTVVVPLAVSKVLSIFVVTASLIQQVRVIYYVSDLVLGRFSSLELAPIQLEQVIECLWFQAQQNTNNGRVFLKDLFSPGGAIGFGDLSANTIAATIIRTSIHIGSVNTQPPIHHSFSDQSRPGGCPSSLRS